MNVTLSNDCIEPRAVGNDPNTTSSAAREYIGNVFKCTASTWNTSRSRSVSLLCAQECTDLGQLQCSMYRFQMHCKRQSTAAQVRRWRTGHQMKPWTHLRSSGIHPFYASCLLRYWEIQCCSGLSKVKQSFTTRSRTVSGVWALGGEQLNRLEPLVPARSKTWGCRGGHLARRAATA